MNLDTEIREALHARTSDVALPPGLLEDVRRGGRRRRRRARVLLAAGPAAAVALVVTGLLVAPRLAYDPPTGDEVAGALSTRDRVVLAEPTRGDLADDAAYLAAVAAAWRTGHDRSINADRGIFRYPVGDPKVVWAGTTPAGRAAIVTQVFDLREHDDVQLDREGPALLWGFVAGETPAVVADGYPVPGAPDTEGALIGADRRLLLVWDRGRPADVTYGGLTYGDDGTARRTWTPLTVEDGVALWPLPAGADPRTVRIRVAGDVADVGNLGADPEDGRSPAVDDTLWADATNQPVWAVGADPAGAWGGRIPDGTDLFRALEAGLAGAVPLLWPDVAQVRQSTWSVAGTTPDGRRLAAAELALDGDPSRVYAVVGEGAAARRVSRVPGAATDPVPVMLPLPDRQGWLVAAKGEELAWRTGTGPWTLAGPDAALLPAAATEVRAGGTAVRLR